MLWDPFLMKMLLKSEVCRFREQYTGPTDVHYPLLILWSNVCHCPVNSDRQLKRKEEEEGKRKTPDAGLFHLYPNTF